MVSTSDVTSFLDKYLGVQNFEGIDIIVNGLEVEGRPEIRRAVYAVSLTREVVLRAVQENVDAIFLHHGIIFRGSRGVEIPNMRRICGSLREKLKIVLQHDINVLAYHLPLDAHPEIGNNITIAKLLELGRVEWIPEERGPPIGVVGELFREVSVDDMFRKVQERINKNAVLLRYGPERVRRVAIVSGAGASYIYRFRKGDVDLFITGEFREDAEVYAHDEQINVIVAGHYATEVFGIKNLAKLLKDRFDIEPIFVETGQIV